MSKEEEKKVVKSTALDIDEVFEAWVAKFIRNTPMAQHTESYNHLTVKALPELKKLLKGE